MPESVYKVIELVGTSTESWDRAAASAVTLASKSLRDLRVAEVTQLDIHILDGGELVYRAKLKVSFKYQAEDDDAPAPKAAKKPRAAKKAAPPPMPDDEDDDEPAPAKKAPRKGKKKA